VAYYKNCVEALRQNSQQAHLFVLLHKMDLVAEELRINVFKEREMDIRCASFPTDVMCFPTTIWDESLYRAWSAIVYSLIPNVRLLEEYLQWFCEICDAQEVILFEKATFLVISHSQTHRQEKKPIISSSLTEPSQPPSPLPPPPPPTFSSIVTTTTTTTTHPSPPWTWDNQRFEKLSNIIKQFKLSCTSQGQPFQAIYIHRPYFSAYLDSLTPNTCLLMIMGTPQIEPAAIQANIHVIRKHFERIESGNSSGHRSLTPTHKS
jgi:Ras-related GTP-binding protein A/B